MTAPAAIRAVFAEWRMVKTRKVLALIFEVPLEQQAEVLTMLGAPMPDAEIWCGIARLAAIGDDEQPIPARGGGRAGTTPELSSRMAGEEVSPDLKGPGARHLSEASQRGKDAYRNATPMEQALVRACQYPKDERFRNWIHVLAVKAGHGRTHPVLITIENAEDYIRKRCCEGKSRSLIAEDSGCCRRFLDMEVEYKQDAGLMAEVRR